MGDHQQRLRREGVESLVVTEIRCGFSLELEKIKKVGLVRSNVKGITFLSAKVRRKRRRGVGERYA